MSGRIHEHPAIAAIGGERDERRVRIGDRDEVRAGAAAESAAHLGPEMPFERGRLRCVEPLLLATRNSARSATRASVASRMARSSVVSSTVSASGAGACRRHVAQDLRAQAAAAHAEQVDVRRGPSARTSPANASSRLDLRRPPRRARRASRGGGEWRRARPAALPDGVNTAVSRSQIREASRSAARRLSRSDTGIVEQPFPGRCSRWKRVCGLGGGGDRESRAVPAASPHWKPH